MTNANTAALPNITPYLLPQEPFNALISKIGARTTWMRSHTCPCTFAGGGALGALPFPGSPQPDCLQCFGIGTYWDPPTLPFMVGVSYMHLSPSPDEPGTIMDPKFGSVQTSEPSVTIPYLNPDDPMSPLLAWTYASTNDMFVMVDMLSRFTAVLQVGGIEVLPYQQNLQIAPEGAVTVYDPVSRTIQFVPYDISGAQVTIDTSIYPVGTNYMVEFQSAPVYVAWRRSGGLPHVRPFGGGGVTLPRRFRLQALDFWTRQRMNIPSPTGSTIIMGKSLQFATGIFGNATGNQLLDPITGAPVLDPVTGLPVLTP